MSAPTEQNSRSSRTFKHLIFAAFYTGIGFILSSQFRYEDAHLATSTSSSKKKLAGEHNLITASDTSTARTRKKPTSELANQVIAIEDAATAENCIRIPRKLLKYLKADSINTETMTFKAPLVEALGLSDAQHKSLDKAVKQISLQAANFQKKHCLLKVDKEGGQYYEIKPKTEDLAAALSNFEALTREALSDIDPAIASAAYSLLEQSPLLSDFSRTRDN
jgi:hypothetical protein